MIKLPNGLIHSWPISLGWQLSLKEEEEEEEEEEKKKTQHNTTQHLFPCYLIIS